MSETTTIKTRAFRVIQSSPELYKAWCDAKTYEQRNLMLVEQAYELGREQGYKEGVAAMSESSR